MPPSPLVSVILVNYNTERFLAASIESIKSQDYPNIETILINSGSPGFVESDWVRFEVDTLINNSSNVGFARANNQGIRASKGEYVLLLNCDAYLAPGAMTNAVQVMEESDDIGQVALKIMNAVRTDVFDSAGHLFRTDRTAAHRGRGERDEGQYAERCDLFGASAAACLYRREALDEAVLEGEFFDADFVNYYEDVDLDWRLRLLGWRCRFAPDALAYHHGHGSGARLDVGVRIEAEKNRYLMMDKCDTFAERLPHLGEILLYEAYHALTYLRRPYLLLGLFKYFLYRARARKKRVKIQKTRKPGVSLIFTQRFGAGTPGALSPLPTLKGLYTALEKPPERTPIPGFKHFLSNHARVEKYLDSPWSGRRPPRVSVVALFLDEEEMTRECLTGLEGQSYPDFEVVILDNGSVAGELSRLEREFPRVKAIRLTENAGFAAGVNRACEHAEGDLVALINNDCVPSPDWLSNLVLRIEETGAKAASGQMEDELEEFKSPHHALSLTGRIIPGAFGDEPKSLFPSGGNSIICKDALAEISDRLPWVLGSGGSGVMSDFYLLYSEDVSLGWRLRLAGFEVEKAADALAFHRGGTTAAKLPSGLVRYLRLRNRLLNLFLFFEAGTLLKVFPFVFLDLLVLHLAGLFYWQLGEPLFAVDRFFILNLRAILRQRRIFQSMRVTRDKEILPCLTSKVISGGGVLNTVARIYARIAGLKVHEAIRQPNRGRS